MRIRSAVVAGRYYRSDPLAGARHVVYS